MDPINTLSTRRDVHRLSSSSSSTPRQGWSRQSAFYTAPIMGGDASRHFELAVSESDRAHRTTALHQLHGNTGRLLSRKGRQANTSSGRPSSTLATQPVLVRAYSGEVEDRSAKPLAMSTRRLFPFTSSRNSSSYLPASPPLPLEQDFSIESIVQAIEPDIRGTLDSIAEICGRSKLSLANEYGSHIAPLGEIHAPPGGLVPVEEASPSDEQRADKDHGLMHPRRDMHSSAFYGDLDSTLRPTASARGQSAALGLSVQAATSDPRVATVDARRYSSPDMLSAALPSTRDFISKPKNCGRDLLATKAMSRRNDHPDQPPGIVTPAVVSEVHVDARANSKTTVPGTPAHLQSSVHDAAPADTPSLGNGQQKSDAIRSLLGLVKWSARVAGPESATQLQSAETKLRAMLQFSDDRCGTTPAA